MKNKRYLLVVVLFLFCSCKKEIKIRTITMNDSLFQTIAIDPKDIENLKEPAKISDIATALEYIPLQTADSVLIGQVQKLIVWNEKYYIWDKLTESIICFDAKGNFSHKLQGQGQGPEEYPRISHFTMDMKNGNIYIYSDMAKAIYEYTEKGDFIKKTSIPFILGSFAIQNDRAFYYLGRMPNNAFYEKEYPNQFRYVVMNNGEFVHQQLNYTFNEKYLNIPLSDNNFSYYKDSVMLVEYLEPKIYAIDSTGVLKPKYRIEFLTNTYSPSFDTEINLEKMSMEAKDGRLATLNGGFYETDDYIFFNYAWGIIGTVYVNKKDGSIHNMGYILVDDFNKNGLSVSLDFVDENYIYKIEDPDLLLKGQSKTDYSSYLNKIIEGMQEIDNPIIVKIRLKK